MTEKLEFVIADPDSAYLQLLAAYIRQSRWAARLSVKWFTKQESLLEELRTSERPAHLYLVPQEWVPAESEKGWIVLAPTNAEMHPIDQQPAHSHRLFKYQPIDRLLTAASEIAEQHRAVHWQGNRAELSGMTVVSILSAAGGTGTSTAAFQLVRLLASRGKRSLLVNLEPICSFLSPDPDYSRQFGQYLYYSRSGSPKASEWIKKLIRRHARCPLDVLGGSGAFREMEEVTAEDIRRLLEHIRSLGVYNTVIIDLDSGVNASVKGAMSASDRLVCMLTEDASSIRKTAEFLNACPKWLDTDSELIRSKLCLAFNRWKGDSGIDFRALGVTVAAKLPYMPQWKLTPAWEHDQIDPLFERPVLQLAEALQIDGNGFGHASTA